MSKSLCEHLLTLKPEKVANHFAKAGKTCTGNKTHFESPLGLCLTCGVVRCDNQSSQCTYQHSIGTKHPLIYKIEEQSIYCFHCKQNVEEGLIAVQQSNKKEKLMDLFEKLMKLSEKLGEKAEMEVVKTQVKIKKQKREPEREFQKSEMGSLLKKEEEDVTDKKHVKIDVFGLKNLGNTCFFNSILQCLYACEELHLKYATLLFDTNRNFGRVGEINILFKKYLHNTEKCFSPKSLFSWAGKVKGAYRHFDQQDAQEFLAIILNGLIDGQRFWHNVKQIHGEKLTESERLFGFYLSSRLECLECKKVSWCSDFTLQLAVHLAKSNSKSFPLPQGDIPKEEVKAEGLAYPPEKISDTFLDNFFAPEALTSKNYFLCQGCETGKAWRKFYIRDPPQTLVISLKRFNNNLSKNNAVVRPPYRLDLQGHCLNKGPLVYELFAISEHSGSSHGGHYIAYTRRGADWYYFSDSNVKGHSWEKVRMGQPYILFYKRIE